MQTKLSKKRKIEIKSYVLFGDGLGKVANRIKQEKIEITFDIAKSEIIIIPVHLLFEVG